MIHQELFTCLVGSHNYNLNVSESDYDYKTFLLPTFDELYARSEVSELPIKSQEKDIDFYDIRKLSTLFWKSNINYLEILFSEEIKINKDLPNWAKFYITEIFAMKEDIARMNLRYLYEACVGTKYTKMKLLNKGSQSSKHLVEKHGYDTKAAMTAYRVLDFLQRYADNGFTDFKSAIWYDHQEDKESYNLLMLLRNGAFPKEEVVNIIESKEVTIKEKYKEIYNVESNLETHEKLNSILKKIILTDLKLRQ